jgi:hypothetical protein
MKVTVLAITKMYTGFCAAGINEKGKWVRLIPRGGYNLTSLKYRDGSYLQVADILEIDGEWKYTQAPLVPEQYC